MRIKYPAIKSVKSHDSPAYADICAHTNDVYSGECPQDKYHKKFGASDVMTSAHETTHQINSEIANSNGGRSKNVGLYMLDDIGFVVDEPTGFTIQQVAQKVPKDFRGGICQVYDLYLVKQAASWGDRPLYLTDEWTAYTNGAVVALQMAKAGDKDSNRWSELQNAIYFNMFCSVLFDMSDKNESLLELMTFQLGRVNGLFQSSQEFGQLVRRETTDLLQQYYASEFYEPFKGSDLLEDYGTGEYL